jgi:Fic family protein
LRRIVVAEWRKGKDPMQVVSGPIGREKVHFEAVPSKRVGPEMKTFFRWWNQPPKGLDGLLRAGLAHLWFVTIHPFADGNGRIARALTDMALAQDERTGRRLYSFSAQIHTEREAYYEILEESQKSTCDITEWLQWFLESFARAIYRSQDIVENALAIAKFWQTHNQGDLNSRQVKAINRLLEIGKGKFEGGLTNRKYVSLNKVSRETAKRDLADLENRGILKRNQGKGRSVSYSLVF